MAVDWSVVSGVVSGGFLVSVSGLVSGHGLVSGQWRLSGQCMRSVCGQWPWSSQ